MPSRSSPEQLILPNITIDYSCAAEGNEEGPTSLHGSYTQTCRDPVPRTDTGRMSIVHKQPATAAAGGKHDVE